MSCNLFGPANPIRYACVWYSEWRLSEPVSLVVILLNSVILALYDYSDREIKTISNQRWIVINHILTGLFGLEAIVKIIAVGFCGHPKSYIRNTWHILDLVMIILG